MIVQEQEARQSKTCPLTMASGNPTPCRGKKCMAWVWFDLRADSDDPPRGYCGLITQHNS